MVFENEFGVATRGQLSESGLTSSEVNRLIRVGDLKLIRRGWYAVSSANPATVEAVRAGGVATCMTALKLRGIWVPPYSGVHIRAGERARRKNPARFCRPWSGDEPCDRAVDDVVVALRHTADCLDGEGFVAVCDSILNKGLLSMSELEAELNSAPWRLRRLLHAVRTDSESGIESLVGFRLRAAHVKFVAQQHIPDVGRVDILIGKRLIIEVDGRMYHSDPEQFERDRARDLEAVRRGYIVIRLSYRTVMYDWERAFGQIMDVIRRRDHLKSPVA